MATTLDDIAQAIRGFIASEAQVPEGDPAFTLDIHLYEAGYLDSIRLVSLMAFIASRLRVELDDSALFSEQFTTIRGIASLVYAAARAGDAPAKTAAPQGDPPIRALARSDLPAVARLYEFVERSQTRNAPLGLEDYFRRILLDQPHADPALPSLVFEENGNIEGFLGVHVRRLRLKDRPIRAACVGQLVVEPRARPKAVGLKLLETFLAGAQDLSLTDGATHDVLAMWEALGGRARAVGNLRWTRVLRPWRFAAGLLARRDGALGRGLALLGSPFATVADGVTRTVTGTRFRSSAPATALREQELTPEALVRRVEASGAPSLRPAYDAEYLRWLFHELGEVRSRGTLRRVLLLDAGTPAGWYVYQLKRGGVAHVLQVGVISSAEAVLAHLFRDAERAGAVAIQGRGEPRLLPTLDRMGVGLDYASSYAVAHTKDPEIAAALHSGDALLTRLDGEWWTGFQQEPHHAAPAPPPALATAAS